MRLSLHGFLGPDPPCRTSLRNFLRWQYKDSSPTLMLSPEAESVGQAYRQAGVALANAKNEPTDHFATECEFVHDLSARRNSRSMARDDQATAALWQARRVAFDDHLARWYGPLSDSGWTRAHVPSSTGCGRALPRLSHSRRFALACQGLTCLQYAGGQGPGKKPAMLSVPIIPMAAAPQLAFPLTAACGRAILGRLYTLRRRLSCRCACPGG